MADITQEDVFSAAEALAAANRPPGVRAVCAELQTTDAGTVLQHLQYWRMTRALRSAPHGALTEALVRSLAALAEDGAEIAEMASAAALARQKAQFDQSRIETDRRAKQAEERSRAAQGDVEALNRRLDVLEAEAAKVRVLSDRVVELEEELKAAEAVVAQLESKLSIADQSRSDAEARAEGAAEQMAAVQQSLADAHAAREALEAQVSSLSMDLASANEQIEKHRGYEQALERESEELVIKMKGEGWWILEDSDLKEVPKRLAYATTRLAALRAERDGLKAHLEDTQKRLDQVMAMLAQRPTTQVFAAATPAPKAATPEPPPSDVRSFSSGGKIEVIRRR